MNRPLFWWFLVLVWAALIFESSTGGFSGDVSRPLLARLLEHLHVALPRPIFLALHIAIRKTAHAVEYGILATLLYAAFGGLQRNWCVAAARRAIIIASLYSLTDEFHQIFVPDRGASLGDCALDAAGACFAMALVYLIHRWPRTSRFA